MKKVYYSYFTLLLVLSLALFGCGSKDSTSKGNTSNTDDSSGTKTETETFTFKVAGQYPIEHPNTVALMKFKERVESETNGNIKLEVFPAAQLGDYTLIYEEIMKGTVEMGLISIPTNFDERMSINWVNYLAESYDVAKKVYTPGSFLYETNEKLNEEAGVKYLGFHVEGFGGVGSMKELKDPNQPGADKGILLRVPPIDIYKQSSEGFGFRTVSIPYAELYQALQTGVADGWAGGPPVANYHDVGDIITHYYQYNDFFEMVPLLMNIDIWNQIGAENQEIIKKAAKDLMMESFEIAEENDQYYMDQMAEKGIEIITFSEEELKSFAEHTREATWPVLEKMLGKEIYEGLVESYQ